LLIVENNILELLNIELKPEALQRVLWISPDRKDVIVVDIIDKKKMKYPFSRNYDDIVNEIQEGMVRIIEIDPDLRLISPDEDYLNKFRVERDANWNVIKDLVDKEPEIYISKKRGSLVKNTLEKTGKSKKEIYRLLKKYWFYGKSINGLLRDYFDCGAPGETRSFKKKPGPKSMDGNEFIITIEDKKIFKKAINKFHEEQKMNLTATHQHMCEESYNSGYYRKYEVLVPIVEPEKMPTLRQFTYWYHNEYSFAEKYSKRHGKRRAAIDVRAFQGDATERALGVGYLFEIDSTPADIILVAEDRKTIIGTPTLYIVKDVFSRLIAGFHASLSPASAMEQMVALENTATNKVEFCKQYGLDIEESDWPCAHLPTLLAGDRGELKAKMTENLVNINVDVANAPSFRGDLKPFVEQHFRLTNQKIRELLSTAGAKPAKPKERGDHDPSRNAALTIYEFTQFMILQIIAFNKSALPKEYFITREMFEDKVELTPLDVWNWGKGKKLLHEVPRNLLRYNLLPKEDATVTRWGIKFNGMFYTSKVALKDGWFEDQHIEGQKQISISYDPRNVSSIFIRLKSGKLEQCYLKEKYKEYEGLHLEEVKTIMRYRKSQLNKKEKEEKQHQAEHHSFSKALSQGAKSETKAATTGMSYYERQKDKKETRKKESRSLGSKNAWTATEQSNSEDKSRQKGEVVSFPTQSSVNPSKGEKSNIQERFGAKNKERRRNHEPME
jgi:hypothetical protein